MRTIKDGWNEYAGLIPKGAGAAQRRETEMSFYAGCLHTIGVLIENSELPDEQAMQALDELMAETRGRFREILDSKHSDERATQ